MSRLDDILTGKSVGIKFANERFEQERRVIDKPEPLDAFERKAAIKDLMMDGFAEALKAESVAGMGARYRAWVDSL